MVLQRLDALVLLTLTGSGKERRGGGATGYVQDTYIAHILPETELNAERQYLWTVSPPMALDILGEQDFLALVEGLEAEFRREYIARQVEEGRERVIIIGLDTGKGNSLNFENSLRELARLVDTAGGEVLLTSSQKRSSPHPQTIIGTGKVQEIALKIQALGANLAVFDRDLSPGQVRTLESQLGVRVVDRTEVILDIFAQRAQSRAGKLQVELAQLEYQLPRLVGRGQAMSRLGGGIGTRGPGETKLESERRAISRRISRLQKEVDQLQAHRSRLRQQRQQQEIPTIAIVGYTNAGKSTLINVLTQANIYAADQLFATLDPTTRRLIILHPKTEKAVTLLLTDTVGFIDELPASLMDAFRATLEEITEADALLHVADLSHANWQQQIVSVKDILAEMPLALGPALLVFNKIDRVEQSTLAKAKADFPGAVFISANHHLGIESLQEQLIYLLERL